MTTTENNILLAQFLGKHIKEGKNYHEFFAINSKPYSANELKFHIDWNWLMEVVEKIEGLGYRTLAENECFMITKSKLSSFDVRSKDDYSTIFSDNYDINHYGGSKKENVYNACVEFIKWYNENGAKNN